MQVCNWFTCSLPLREYSIYCKQTGIARQTMVIHRPWTQAGSLTWTILSPETAQVWVGAEKLSFMPPVLPIYLFLRIWKKPPWANFLLLLLGSPVLHIALIFFSRRANLSTGIQTWTIWYTNKFVYHKDQHAAGIACAGIEGTGKDVLTWYKGHFLL